MSTIEDLREVIGQAAILRSLARHRDYRDRKAGTDEPLADWSSVIGDSDRWTDIALTDGTFRVGAPGTDRITGTLTGPSHEELTAPSTPTATSECSEPQQTSEADDQGHDDAEPEGSRRSKASR